MPGDVDIPSRFIPGAWAAYIIAKVSSRPGSQSSQIVWGFAYYMFGLQIGKISSYIKRCN